VYGQAGRDGLIVASRVVEGSR